MVQHQIERQSDEVAAERRDTRSRALDAAFRLFSQRGYEATSMREIAERAGVTKATLYYHFQNKADLVRSLYESYQVEVEGLVTWAKRDPRPDPDAVLAAWATLVIEHGSRMMRFVQESPHIWREILPERITTWDALAELASVLIPPEADRTMYVRARMAVQVISTMPMVHDEAAMREEDLVRLVLQIATRIMRDDA